MRKIINEVQVMGLEDIFFSWDEKISLASAENIICLAVLAAVGLLLCLLGLKIVRAWAALAGLAAGFAGGAAAAYYLGLDGTGILIAGAAAGIILAFLGAFFYRFGVFLTVFISTCVIYAQIVQPDELLVAAAGLAAALVAAVLAVIFVEAITVIVTSVCGAVLAGTSLYQLIPVRGRLFSILLCVVFAAAGIIVQLLLESKKRKKKNLQKAAEIREMHSAENDVERARSLIDDFDKMPDEPEKNGDDDGSGGNI